MTQDVPPEAPDHSAVNATGQSTESLGTLKLAMRRARTDDAERAGARSETRAARLGRLEMLQDALQPLLAQIPSDIDMFDVALVPSTDPRLFIDMIGFVEMGRDARTFILQQDTRHGRIRVAESDHIEKMVDAVTDYVARRLIERDKALASDARAQTSALSPQDQERRDSECKSRGRERSTASQSALPTAQVGGEPMRQANLLRWAAIGFAFLIDLLGAIAFFMILGILGWYVWSRMHAPM